MTKQYDLIVYIGRFQPFHNGHKAVIDKALTLAEKVLVIIGSANEPRTFKNPFDASERHNMIYFTYPSNSFDMNGGDVVVEYQENSAYNDQVWCSNIQKLVSKYSKKDSKIGIIGHAKDESSYYLKMFPQWEFIDHPMVHPLDATTIRELYFSDKLNFSWFDGIVPKQTIKMLKAFSERETYKQIKKEKEFIENYKKQFEHLPYPPIFMTTDAVVIQSGHVLLIKRKAEPGKGLWAFPGGFINAKTDASVEDAMIRELREETGIKVPEKVLRGSIEKQKIFDKIDRSARGRTITVAFKIVLEDDGNGLPRVKGADDAEKAKWVPISEVKRSECFEDHYDILKNFLGQ